MLVFHECGVSLIILNENNLRMPPVIHLATHGFKASLNPVNTHCQRVNQVEALRMLGQNRRKHARDNVSEPLMFRLFRMFQLKDGDPASA